MGNSPPVPADERQITRLFDRLLLEGVTPERLLARSALAMRATVGHALAAGGGIARDSHGSPTAPHPLPPAVTRAVEDGWVWAEGVASDTVEHFLDRLAAALAIVERWGAAFRDTREPLDVLVDVSASSAARESAMARLGRADSVGIRVLICSGPLDGVRRLTEAVAVEHTTLARSQRDDKTTLLILDDGSATIELAGVPVGVRVSYGRVRPLARAHEAYRSAHDAYVFTRPSPHDLGPYQPIHGVLIDGARLTGLTALCRLRREDIELVEEIAVLDALVAEHGDQIIHLLEAYAITGSLRQAASQVFLHHNSVAYWVHKAEAELGYSLAEANRRAQFFITVCLYRIWREYRSHESA